MNIKNLFKNYKKIRTAIPKIPAEASFNGAKTLALLMMSDEEAEQYLKEKKLTGKNIDPPLPLPK